MTLPISGYCDPAFTADRSAFETNSAERGEVGESLMLMLGYFNPPGYSSQGVVFGVNQSDHTTVGLHHTEPFELHVLDQRVMVHVLPTWL